MGLASVLKTLLVSPERKPRTILAGRFKGIKMHLSLRDQMQIYLGTFERETHPSLKRMSKGLKTAVDIGAAYGEHSLFFLVKTTATKIYAFEPDASCHALLHENLKLNGISPSPRFVLSSMLVGGSETDSQICLDSLLSSIETPCLIKMDVDGGEQQILRGATKLNNLQGIRWLIETHSKELEVACIEILSDAGFETKIIPNAVWRVILPELRPIPHNRWLAAWKNDV